MITSTANQKVKRLAVLQKKRRARDEEGISCRKSAGPGMKRAYS